MQDAILLSDVIVDLVAIASQRKFV